MKTTDVSRAALGRIPVYLKFIESLPQDVETVSATTIAKALGFGEVQVRKDLGAICGSGKPRIGYTVSDLKASLECLIDSRNGKTVIVGAGKLGRALLDYGGFPTTGSIFSRRLTRRFRRITQAENRYCRLTDCTISAKKTMSASESLPCRQQRRRKYATNSVKAA